MNRDGDSLHVRQSLPRSLPGYGSQRVLSCCLLREQDFTDLETEKPAAQDAGLFDVAPGLPDGDAEIAPLPDKHVHRRVPFALFGLYDLRGFEDICYECIRRFRILNHLDPFPE